MYVSLSSIPHSPFPPRNGRARASIDANVDPKDKTQLAACLACARNSSTKVSALGGGHSFVAFGYGNAGNLVVSMQAFNAMAYDEASGLFTVGGGVRVGPAVKYLWDTAGKHFPHVRHGRVGMVGSCIGGGFGATSRFLGTPMDAMTSVEYMLYNGTLKTVEPGSDLMFAAQGAGSSYGIITALTTQTITPAYATVMNYSVSLPEGITIDGAIAAFLSLQEFALTVGPEGLSVRWSLADNPPTFEGFYYDDPATFDQAMEPLMRSLPNGTTIERFEMTFWESEVSSAVGVDKPDGGTSPPRSFFLQSLVMTIDNPFTEETVRALFENVAYGFKFDGLSRSGTIDLWGGVSSQYQDGQTSFVHGNNLWLVRFDCNLRNTTQPYPEGGVEYAKSLMKPLEDAITRSGAPLRSFVNYRDDSLKPAEWIPRLYGEENFKRLQEIKSVYDPEEMFTNNLQSISKVTAASR